MTIRFLRGLMIAICAGFIGAARSSGSPKNGAPEWLDADGNPINCHCGGIFVEEGVYWWYGEHRDATRRGHQCHTGIRCYSSTDLRTWKPHGVVLAVTDEAGSPIGNGCMMERPKVLRSRSTGKYVMYFHQELPGQYYSAARTGIAVADRPEGPFRYVKGGRPDPFKTGERVMARDQTLFRDDDGKTYHVFATDDNATLMIAELTDDLLDYTGRAFRILPIEYNEAPALMRHDGWYYLLTSGTTGWASNPARVHRARRLEGPWENVGNPCRGTNPLNGVSGARTWGGQSSHIFRVAGTDAPVALFDILHEPSPDQSRYIMVPVRFTDKGRMILDWYDEATWKPTCNDTPDGPGLLLEAGIAKFPAGRDLDVAAQMARFAAETVAVRATRYVDSERGDDVANDGLSPERPWKSLKRLNGATLMPGTTVRFRAGCVFRGQLQVQSGKSDGSNSHPIVYTSYGEGAKPVLQPSVAADDPAKWRDGRDGTWSFGYDADNDAGNVIFDDGAGGCAVRRNARGDLDGDLDFWCDVTNRCIVLKSRENPARRFRSIEVAIKVHAVDEAMAHDVVYDGLSVRYSAAHGFGGTGVRNVVIRNCDVSWIGGGYLYRDFAGRGVRYGNGIELWANAENVLVESNRVWECWDAGLTNQSSEDGSVQRNIAWRGNEVWNCEYSYEYWHQGTGTRTENVVFVGNRCRDAGKGWGHVQRWNPNAAHLMFYDTTADVKSFDVRNNLFDGSADTLMRCFGEAIEDMAFAGNEWKEGPAKSICRYHGRPKSGLKCRYPDRLDRTHRDDAEEIESQGRNAHVFKRDERQAFIGFIRGRDNDR